MLRIGTFRSSPVLGPLESSWALPGRSWALLRLPEPSWAFLDPPGPSLMNPPGSSWAFLPPPGPFWLTTFYTCFYVYGADWDGSAVLTLLIILYRIKNKASWLRIGIFRSSPVTCIETLNGEKITSKSTHVMLAFKMELNVYL